MRDATGRMTYAVEEVAVLVGVSRTTMYGLVAAGRVPSVRLGRIVILLPAVRELLDCDPPSPAELRELLRAPLLAPIESECDRAPAKKPASKRTDRPKSVEPPRLFG
jgi:excisionase family DNA binding protein